MYSRTRRIGRSTGRGDLNINIVESIDERLGELLGIYNDDLLMVSEEKKIKVK